MRETIERNWANIYYKTSYKTTKEKGIFCTIIVKKELLEKRIERFTGRTHNHFFSKPWKTYQEFIYTGFSPETEYKNNIEKGKQIAYHRAFATYHGEHIEILNDLRDSLKRLEAAIERTEEIERREMETVKNQTRKLLAK